jgi:ABC-type sugar transport system permease subunit
MDTVATISAKRRGKFSFSRRKLLPYLLVSPYLIYLFVFVLFPVFFCLFLTFNSWNIIGPMRFIGIDNYVRLFHDRLFWKAIGNTLKFLVLHIPLQLVVSLFLAYLLNNTMKGVAFSEDHFSCP